MVKPYLISLTSNVAGIENYIRTLDALADSVEPIMVSFSPQVPLSPDYRTIRVDQGYPGNLSRFKFFPFEELDSQRMVIFTDTSDVIFQCPIPELEDKIYVAPESAKFDKQSWFNQMFLRHGFTLLDDMPIYNMGTWAMPVYKAQEMLTFVLDGANLFRYEEQADQPLYNLWLKNQQFEEHPSLMSCLFNNYEQKNLIKTERGWVNKHDDLYSIVHANGNNKDLLIK